MSWPLSQDYNEAIQSPATNFAAADLKKGEAVANALGIPMPYSGNFADVYQVRCPDGSRWAVKCFTREAIGLRERYQEISVWLRRAKLPFTVDFSYLEQGIRVAGKWYPVLKMQWVEGLTLNQFVAQYLDKPAMLEALLQLWAKMGKYLRAARVGHCDLQHGNVLLVPGSTPNALALKLIDYDGMWIPPLAKSKSGEVGHANYQHPRRLREGTYSLEVDRFPLLLVATAMRALKADKGLWAKYDNGDNLLFKESDLAAPGQSALFEELASLPDPGLVMLAAQVRAALKGSLESTALLEDVMPVAKGPPSGAGLTKTAPKAEKAFAFDDAGPPSMRTNRKPSTKIAAGSPVGLLVAAVVGLVALIGGAAGAFVLMRGSGVNKPEAGALLVQTRPLDTGANEAIKSTPPEEHQDESPTKAVPTELSPNKEIVNHPNGGPTPSVVVADSDGKGPIGEVRQFEGHTGDIRRLAVSPDGKQLLTASFDKTVRLWDIATGRELQKMEGHTDAVHSVVFLSDGARALSASSDKTVRLWDLKDGQEIRSFSDHKQPVYTVAVTPDGKIAASCGLEDVVFLWNVETGKEVRRLEGDKGGTDSVAFSPDGKLLATGAERGAVRLWNVETGKEVRRCIGHAGNVFTLAFSADGRLLLSCGKDQTACLWNVDDGREMRRFGRQMGPLWGSTFSSNGRVLTAGYAGEVRLWDATTAKELYRFPRQMGRIWAVEFSPDGRYGFSAGEDRVAHMWRLPPANYVPPASLNAPPPVVKKPEPKPAAPDEAALASADKEIKDVHKAEFAKKKTADVEALAVKLLQEGIDTKDQPADRFALLRKARDLAAKIGDFPLALRAVDEMANRFDVDAQEMTLKTMEAGSRAAGTPLANARVAEAALPLAEEGEDADDFDSSDRYLKIAQGAARATNIAALISAVQGRATEIEALRKAYEPVKAAQQTLADKPDDADASLVLGTYLCLSKGAWSRGLPALAQGSDPKLKALAVADLGSTSDPDAQVELAKNYLAQAEGESGAAKIHLRRRACYWYQKAEIHLTGLPRTEAIKKIAEIEKTMPRQHPAIVRAYYGTNNDWQDVTDRVRAYLIQGKGQKLSVKADAGELGVPNHNNGQGKTLVVVYQLEGQTYLSITPEGGTAVIPAAPGVQDTEAMWPAPGQELLILAARYGAEGTWVDATAQVQHLVRGQTLSGVKGDGFGLGDPAFGKGKAMLIVFRYGNRTRFRAFGGDESVELGAVPAKP